MENLLEECSVGVHFIASMQPTVDECLFRSFLILVVARDNIGTSNPQFPGFM